MLGPFTTASRLTPIHQMSLAVLSRATCASMSTTPTTTMTTRDRGDRYGPMEWAQQELHCAVVSHAVWKQLHTTVHYLLYNADTVLLVIKICTHSKPLCITHSNTLHWHNRFRTDVNTHTLVTRWQRILIHRNLLHSLHRSRIQVTSNVRQVLKSSLANKVVGVLCTGMGAYEVPIIANRCQKRTINHKGTTLKSHSEIQTTCSGPSLENITQHY